MSFHHKAQTTNIQMVPIFPNNNLSVSSAIVVACMQGQFYKGYGVVMLLIPLCFFISLCTSCLSQMLKEDTWLCWGYKVKKVNKVKRICRWTWEKDKCNMNEWIKERDGMWRVAGFELNGEMFCGCLSGLDESCIFDEMAHTTAELKVAGLLSRNNGPGHKCCLVFVCFTMLGKNFKIFAKNPPSWNQQKLLKWHASEKTSSMSSWPRPKYIFRKAIVHSSILGLIIDD